MCRWWGWVCLACGSFKQDGQGSLIEKVISKQRLEAGEGGSQKEEATVNAKFLKLELIQGRARVPDGLMLSD